MRYLFTIFNRLNSGGVRLSNQEIRNCIYSGKFNDLLKDFDRHDKAWAQIKRRIWGKLDRFRSVEILLRALAFSSNLNGYDGNLAAFLNDFMHSRYREGELLLVTIKRDLAKMSKIASTVLASVGTGKRSLTFIEGVLVGVLKNVGTIPDEQPEGWASSKAAEFLNLPAFDQGARYGLSNAQTVKERLGQAIGVFTR